MKNAHPNMAALVKKARGAMSQAKLAQKLGYKNGQYISNTERQLTSFPDDKLKELAEALEIPVSQLIDAKLADEKLKLEKLAGIRR